MNLADQSFVWRCDRCGSATVLTGAGGNLNCVCPEPHNEVHFQVLTPGGHFELELWYNPNDLSAPGVRSLP